MDDVLRYPKAYARLCRAGISGGVLDAFLPYVLQPHELDHLSNADFDPTLFRVDAYGNFVYLHTHSASPSHGTSTTGFPAPMPWTASSSSSAPVPWRMPSSSPCHDAMEDAIFILMP
ncbi:hypothetical protein D1007_29821 [Hordeum vulgare]|nr:hypothetical protein D1007_29821 [Hordeum vulgare]